MHGRRFTITISGTNEATTASYVTVRTPADGHVWNGSAFEVSNPAHWSTYVFNTTPLGSGLATLTIADSVLPTGADYLFSLYTFTTGGTPASTDTLAGIRKVYNWGPKRDGRRPKHEHERNGQHRRDGQHRRNGQPSLRRRRR